MQDRLPREDPPPDLVDEYLRAFDEGAGIRDRLEKGAARYHRIERGTDTDGEIPADTEMLFQVDMPGSTDLPDLRERREDVIRPVLPLTPNGQAASLGQLSRDAESRDCRVPQKIDVRRVARIARRQEQVSMGENRLYALPARDLVAVLHDERVNLVDGSGADGECCPTASGACIRICR